MLAEIFLHEVVVTLLVGRFQADIFIQIYRFDFGEIEVSLFVPVDELMVHTDGAGAGSKSDDAVRFQDHLCREDVCRFSAHGFVVFRDIDFHNTRSLIN